MKQTRAEAICGHWFTIGRHSAPCAEPPGHDGWHRCRCGMEWPPAGASAFICCECGRDTAAPVQVRYIERPSAPGVAVYACPDCAPWLSPRPGPDDLLPPTQTL